MAPPPGVVLPPPPYDSATPSIDSCVSDDEESETASPAATSPAVAVAAPADTSDAEEESSLQSWERLPPGWMPVTTDEGDVYYWHAETNEVTREMPITTQTGQRDSATHFPTTAL